MARARPRRARRLGWSLVAASVLAAACGGERLAHRIPAGERVELPFAVREATRARLEAIGYLGATGEIAGGGVELSDPGKGSADLTLWSSAHAPLASLTRPNGDTVQRWTWRDARPPYTSRQESRWRRVEALPNGDLIALFDGTSVMRLDRESRLVWLHTGRAHDDLHLLPDGGVLTLTSVEPTAGAPASARDELLTWLGPDGELRRRLSLADCFERSDLGTAWRPGVDLVATGVEALDGDRPNLPSGVTGGQVLVSLSSPEALASVDPTSCEVVWLLPTSAPMRLHQILADGSLLLERRAVGGPDLVVLDPVSGDVGWQYRAAEERATDAARVGQRLGDGGTLVVVGEQGRIVELDASSRPVWSYANPLGMGPARGYRAAIVDARRLPPDYFTERRVGRRPAEGAQ